MPPVTIGYFDKSGNAVIKIVIRGAYQAFSREFEAIIDTGFTGFISLPLTAAFPLALILFGTTSVTLADNSTAYKLTAFGFAALEGEEAGGIIILEPNGAEVLVGMDFLRKLKRAFLLSERRVLLIPEEEIPHPPESPSTQN